MFKLPCSPTNHHQVVLRVARGPSAEGCENNQSEFVIWNKGTNVAPCVSMIIGGLRVTQVPIAFHVARSGTYYDPRFKISR
jgi:hypothetical protein